MRVALPFLLCENEKPTYLRKGRVCGQLQEQQIRREPRSSCDHRQPYLSIPHRSAGSLRANAHGAFRGSAGDDPNDDPLLPCYCAGCRTAQVGALPPSDSYEGRHAAFGFGNRAHTPVAHFQRTAAVIRCSFALDSLCRLVIGVLCSANHADHCQPHDDRISDPAPRQRNSR